MLCSDVVYEPEAYDPLIRTLRALLAGGRVAIMAHRSRHPDEHLFWSAAARHFTVRLLHGPPFVPLGAEEGTAAILPAAGMGGLGDAAPEGAQAGAAVRVLEMRLLS